MNETAIKMLRNWVDFEIILTVLGLVGMLVLMSFNYMTLMQQSAINDYLVFTGIYVLLPLLIIVYRLIALFRLFGALK